MIEFVQYGVVVVSAVVVCMTAWWWGVGVDGVGRGWGVGVGGVEGGKRGGECEGGMVIYIHVFMCSNCEWWL